MYAPATADTNVNGKVLMLSRKSISPAICKLGFMACRLFVEVAPGTLGLVHNSELEVSKFGNVADWEVGDTLDVKVISVSLCLLHPEAPSQLSLGQASWL